MPERKPFWTIWCNFSPVAQICAKLDIYSWIGTTVRSYHKKFGWKIPVGSKVMSKKLKNTPFYVVKLTFF